MECNKGLDTAETEESIRNRTTLKRKNPAAW